MLADGYLQNPGASIKLLQKGTINVMVLGAVNSPGIHALPRYENDVAHALAAAGGFSDVAGQVIEIHRQQPGTLSTWPTADNLPNPDATVYSTPFPGSSTATPMSTPMPQAWDYSAPSATVSPSPVVPQPVIESRPAFAPPADNPQPLGFPQPQSYLQSTTLPMVQPAGLQSPQNSYRGGHSLNGSNGMPVIRGQSPSYMSDPAAWPPPGVNSGPIITISLRGQPYPVNPDDVVLHAGDVVVVPRRTDEVFYVVGPLAEQSRIRFSVGDRDREIGNGLLLPPDREIDVVTAVAMAGYIDPIESPTTVTVHRCGPDGMPLLVKVDLIAARANPRETILVQPGDIIYLNPDHWWYWRRMVDRVVDQALGTAIGRWLTN
jgi:hypothetical protein